MTTEIVVSLLIAVGFGLITPMFFKLQAELTRLRENELAHIYEMLVRIEDKLDAHIQWHVDNSPG